MTRLAESFRMFLSLQYVFYQLLETTLSPDWAKVVYSLCECIVLTTHLPFIIAALMNVR